MLAMPRKLLLKAVLHNWGMICAYDGDWLTVTWKIYESGFYIIDEESFHPVDPEEENSRIGDEHYMSVNRKDHVISKGYMSAMPFMLLKDAMEQEPWRDPAVYSDGNDGVAWMIEQYENGKVIRSSGILGYIYGQKNLEKIVSRLPKASRSYGASGCVFVRRDYE